MATQNLQLSLPAFNSSNWNQALNSNWAIVDAAAGASAAVSVTAVDYALKATDLQNSRIQIVGNHGGADISVVFPDGIGGKWIVTNNAFTSGGKLYVHTATYTQNRIEIPVGSSLLIYSDGANLGTISLSPDVMDDFLKVSGGTMKGDLILERNIWFKPFADQDPSSRISDDGQMVGFYNKTASARAVMEKSTGKWFATGGVGIGVNGAVAAALASYCPSAVYEVSGEKRMMGLAIEDVLVKLVEEIASLKAQIASKSL